MSLYKNRNGKGLFRFRAISGFIKVLFDRKKKIDNDELNNTMKAKFNVKNKN